LDIVIESIIGILVIVVGAVKSIENEPSYTIDGKNVDDPDSILKEVQINEKVYTSDKYLKPIEMKKAVEVIEKIGLSDYEVFETRVEFIDILAKRKEYRNWIEQS
jgi:Membrane magnesium transporter.